jgi:hypothetical protein
MQRVFVLLALATAISNVVILQAGADERMPLDVQFRMLPDDLRNAYRAHLTPRIQQQVATIEFQRQLKSSSANDRDSLLRYIAELVIFSFGKKPNLYPQDDPWGAGMIVLSTPRELVLDAIVPELGTEGRMKDILTRGDQDLRKFLERDTDGSLPSIDEYLTYLKNHSFEKSEGLIEYLLRFHLERSFVGLVKAHSPVLADQGHVLAAHFEIWAWLSRLAHQPRAVVDDRTSTALGYLSEHAEWWVRLYVAEIVQQHPELRTDALMKRLRDDPHQLVRDAIKGQK